MAKQVYVKYDMRLNRLMSARLSYDTFRSEVGHMYHFDGDYLFVSKVMKANLITKLWNKKEHAKALYILAVIDYLSWKNKVPFFPDFEPLRSCKLNELLFPAEVIMMDKIEHSDTNRKKALETCKNDECGRFFFRHNIIERNI